MAKMGNASEPDWADFILRQSVLVGTDEHSQIGSNHAARWYMPDFFLAHADPAVLEIRG